MCRLTTRERQTAASTASMPNARLWRRGQAPKPQSGAPKAQGLTAAIAVAAPSNVPSFALKSTGVDRPIGTSAYTKNLHHLDGRDPADHRSGRVRGSRDCERAARAHQLLAEPRRTADRLLPPARASSSTASNVDLDLRIRLSRRCAVCWSRRIDPVKTLEDGPLWTTSRRIMAP